ncbi:hypothetical protein HYW21_02415 [Candidatus Woesearchaeota archaeon]|nr:hypothetical protein [Candidatus Woesearchaeota archaeon]
MKQITPVLAPHAKTIRASYDPLRDWRMDKKGYFLIRINPDTKTLEVGHCKKNNVIETLVIGDTPEEIYMTIIHEKLSDFPPHCAYLGKELQKAFIARALGIPYVQDDPLDLSSITSRKKKSPNP